MTDSTQTRHPSGHGGGKDSCDDCDPDLLDAIKCRAKGVQARADYNANHLKDLEKAREQLTGARAAYMAARTAATPLVKKLWDEDDLKESDLRSLLKRLDCLLDGDENVRREIAKKIHRAFWEVQETIKECGSKTGCYLTDDCNFGNVSDCDPYDVPSRLADIQRRTAKAEACFADLIAVPTKLPTDVTDLQAEVKKISEGAAGEPPLEVVVELYAAALVARQHARDIWRGFTNVNEFVDCVCHALTCMLKGHTAIAILTGKEAVRKCQRESREADCDRLRTKTAEEVVAVYLRHQRGDRPAVASGEQAAASASGESGGERPGEDRAASDRQATRKRTEAEYWAG